MRSMEKLIISVFVAMCTLAMPTMVFADISTDVSITIDGEVSIFEVSPQIIDDRVMLPARSIFEALGANVDWDEDNRKLIAINPLENSSSQPAYLTSFFRK